MHKFLGFTLHAYAEANNTDGTYSRVDLLNHLKTWLSIRGNSPDMAASLFRVGEERLGLIVALKGEGESTHYGFEVQPVREYFAAAYINDIYEGDAHAIFQAMVQRSFWKEVAMFLAGLRRDNEKADLIARARELDRGLSDSWQQNGRKIIQNLLQEGVFSQPPYLFSEAMIFLLELLDKQHLYFADQPDGYIGVIKSLLKTDQVDLKRIPEYLLDLLAKYQYEEDEYQLQRLMHFLGCLTNYEELIPFVDAFTSHDPEFEMRVKILWPWLYGFDAIEEHFLLPDLEKYDDHLVAKHIWLTANKHPAILDTPFPRHYHQLFVENSCFYQYEPSLDVTSRKSSFAIWHLAFLQTLLFNALFGEDLPTIRSGVPANLVENSEIEIRQYAKPGDLNFDGLSILTSELLEGLLDMLGDFVSYYDELDQQEQLLLDNRVILLEYLHTDEISGWLAVNTITRLLGYFNYVFMSERTDNRRVHTFADELFTQHTELVDISDQLNQFYIGSRRNNTRTLFSIRLRERTRRIPTYVNLNGEPTPVAKIIELSLKEQINQDHWFNYMPISTRHIRYLVDEFRDEMEYFLDKMGHREVIFEGGAALHASSMNKIASIVRRTDDPSILGGALKALYYSKFLKTLGSDLIIKILRSERNNGLFSRILSQNRPDRANIDKDEYNILLTVVEEIKTNPDYYDSRLTTTAAEFLRNHRVENKPPLLEIFDDLL